MRCAQSVYMRVPEKDRVHVPFDVCIHVYIHACFHICVCARVFLNLWMYVRACVILYECSVTYEACIHMCVCVCMYVQMHVCIVECMHACMHLDMLVNIWLQTNSNLLTIFNLAPSKMNTAN